MDIQVTESQSSTSLLRHAQPVACTSWSRMAARGQPSHTHSRKEAGAEENSLLSPPPKNTTQQLYIT